MILAASIVNVVSLYLLTSSNDGVRPAIGAFHGDQLRNVICAPPTKHLKLYPVRLVEINILVQGDIDSKILEIPCVNPCPVIIKIYCNLHPVTRCIQFIVFHIPFFIVYAVTLNPTDRDLDSFVELIFQSYIIDCLVADLVYQLIFSLVRAVFAENPVTAVLLAIAVADQQIGFFTLTRYLYIVDEPPCMTCF